MSGQQNLHKQQLWTANKRLIHSVNNYK